MMVSLQQTPPEAVFEMMVLRSASLAEKMYKASGLSLKEFTVSDFLLAIAI